MLPEQSFLHSPLVPLAHLLLQKIYNLVGIVFQRRSKHDQLEFFAQISQKIYCPLKKKFTYAVGPESDANFLGCTGPEPDVYDFIILF
jgi:hypothetical protein